MSSIEYRDEKVGLIEDKKHEEIIDSIKLNARAHGKTLTLLRLKVSDILLILHQLDNFLLHIRDDGRQLLEGQLQLFVSLNQRLKPALFFLALDFLIQA